MCSTKTIFDSFMASNENIFLCDYSQTQIIKNKNHSNLCLSNNTPRLHQDATTSYAPSWPNCFVHVVYSSNSSVETVEWECLNTALKSKTLTSGAFNFSGGTSHNCILIAPHLSHLYTFPGGSVDNFGGQ
mmetsp:Transcript_22544/g.40097  ORF Transcript_22544/g.40097 Transcript_22544/m.40097 type:complete len:130 (-) Transcript_22544:1538-1927(-)